MGLETATTINDLNESNPDGAVDPKGQGDNHLRMIKSVLKNTFSGLSGRFLRIQTKSGDYTGLTTDNLSTIVFSAAATLNLSAAATLGNGWMALVSAYGGDVTVDPSSSETVNGAATVKIKRGRAALVLCDGSGIVLLELPTQGGSMPAGAIVDFAGTTAPDGWLLCYGQAVSRSTYAALFEAIGTTYGVGDGSTTFNLPDYRGRVSAGKDDMGGSAASRLTNAVSGVDGATLGAAGGNQNVHQHNHNVSGTTSGFSNDHTHGVSADGLPTTWNGANNDFGGGTAWSRGGNYTSSGQSADHTHTFNVNSGNAGSGSSQNVQPTIVSNKIIKT